MGNSVPDKEWKILALKSGGRCAFPDCKKVLVVSETLKNDPKAIIGEIAHIKGEKPGSSRYDKNMTDEERSSHKNLIFLCREHHKIVDSQEKEYNVDKLLEIKSKHELWVEDQLRTAITEITFSELKVIMDYLIECTDTGADSLDLIAESEKIKKNHLSNQTERLLKIGGAQVKQVKDYLNSCKDINFEKRLINGFSEKYKKLKEEGLNGDDMFNYLLSFASNNSNDLRIQAAGLTVLSYLFERCEVFEK